MPNSTCSLASRRASASAGVAAASMNKAIERRTRERHDSRVRTHYKRASRCEHRASHVPRLTSENRAGIRNRHVARLLRKTSGCPRPARSRRAVIITARSGRAVAATRHDRPRRNASHRSSRSRFFLSHWLPSIVERLARRRRAASCVRRGNGEPLAPETRRGRPPRWRRRDATPCQPPWRAACIPLPWVDAGVPARRWRQSSDPPPVLWLAGDAAACRERPRSRSSDRAPRRRTVSRSPSSWRRISRRAASWS